jgi:hypothetical protein
VRVAGVVAAVVAAGEAAEDGLDRRVGQQQDHDRRGAAEPGLHRQRERGLAGLLEPGDLAGGVDGLEVQRDAGVVDEHARQRVGQALEDALDEDQVDIGELALLGRALGRAAEQRLQRAEEQRVLGGQDDVGAVPRELDLAGGRSLRDLRRRVGPGVLRAVEQLEVERHALAREAGRRGAAVRLDRAGEAALLVGGELRRAREVDRAQPPRAPSSGRVGLARPAVLGAGALEQGGQAFSVERVAHTPPSSDRRQRP